jgi:hypothetical protein
MSLELAQGVRALVSRALMGMAHARHTHARVGGVRARTHVSEAAAAEHTN